VHIVRGTFPEFPSSMITMTKPERSFPIFDRALPSLVMVALSQFIAPTFPAIAQTASSSPIPTSLLGGIAQYVEGCLVAIKGIIGVTPSPYAFAALAAIIIGIIAGILIWKLGEQQAAGIAGQQVAAGVIVVIALMTGFYLYLLSLKPADTNRTPPAEGT